MNPEINFQSENNLHNLFVQHAKLKFITVKYVFTFSSMVIVVLLNWTDMNWKIPDFNDIDDCKFEAF